MTKNSLQRPHLCIDIGNNCESKNCWNKFLQQDHFKPWFRNCLSKWCCCNSCSFLVMFASGIHRHEHTHAHTLTHTHTRTHTRCGQQIVLVWMINPFNAKATFVQCTRMQRFMKTTETLSCWYSLESSRRVFSDEYPFARVSVIFQDFCIILDRKKLPPAA